MNGPATAMIEICGCSLTFERRGGDREIALLGVVEIAEIRESAFGVVWRIDLPVLSGRVRSASTRDGAKLAIVRSTRQWLEAASSPARQRARASA